MTRRLIEHGWHFLREDMRLGYDDGRLVKPGKASSSRTCVASQAR